MMTAGVRTKFATCPKCDGISLNAVTDSRQYIMGDRYVIRRIRHCDNCNENISTVEVPEVFLREIAEYSKIIDLIRKLPSFAATPAHTAVAEIHSAKAKKAKRGKRIQ